MTDNSYQFDSHCEEVYEIVDRMPNRFSNWVTALIVAVVLGLIVGGAIIQYPDVVVGLVTIKTSHPPVRLIAGSSGKIDLLVDAQQQIEEGSYLAVIENSTPTSSVRTLDSLLRSCISQISRIAYLEEVQEIDSFSLHRFPKSLMLGDLTPAYYAFLSALEKWEDYVKDNVYEQQLVSLTAKIESLRVIQNHNVEQYNLRDEQFLLAKKFYSNDSILFVQNFSFESELDRSRMNLLVAKENLASLSKELDVTNQSILEFAYQCEQVVLQQKETSNLIKANLISSYHNLLASILSWEQKFVIKAPVSGILDFLKFVKKNDYVQAGEPLFSVLSADTELYGEMILPSMGAGKVTEGQVVVIKLDDYPYIEYGAVKGTVSSMSLVAGNQKLPNQSEVSSYLVTIALPEGLTTNYNSILMTKHELNGSAEIITKNRRLFQRLFDNLKYRTRK